MTSRFHTRPRPGLLLLAPVAMTTMLFVVPVLTMASESLHNASGLTLEHYVRFFGDWYYLEALGTTIGTSILVMLVTAIVCFPIAYTYWQASGRLRSLLVVLLLSPFYANVVVKVFGWMAILPASFLNSYSAVLLVSVHRAMPFMVLAVASALARDRTRGPRVGADVRRTVASTLSHGDSATQPARPDLWWDRRLQPDGRCVCRAATDRRRIARAIPASAALSADHDRAKLELRRCHRHGAARDLVADDRGWEQAGAVRPARTSDERGAQ